MNIEKLRSPTSAAFKNSDFESFCELGKSSKYSLKDHSFVAYTKKPKILTPPPPPHTYNHPKLVQKTGVTEAKEMSENFAYVGKKRFTFCKCGYPQSYKKSHLPKSHQQLSAKLLKISWALNPIIVDVINQLPLRPTFKNPNFESKDELNLNFTVDNKKENLHKTSLVTL